MVNLAEDIRALTDFKRHTVDFVNQMKETRHPVVLTVNGRAELVVQDAEGNQRTMDRLAYLETVAAIREGVATAAEGRVQPAREAMAALQEKLALSR